jgi:hypothetical protein
MKPYFTAEKVKAMLAHTPSELLAMSPTPTAMEAARKINDLFGGALTASTIEAVADIIHAHYPSPPLATIRQAKEALEDIANMPEYDQDDAHRLRHKGKTALTALLAQSSGPKQPECMTAAEWGEALSSAAHENSLLAGEGEARPTNAQHLAMEICELLHGPADEGDEAFSRDVSEVAELLEKRASTPASPPPPSEPGDKEMLDWLEASGIFTAGSVYARSGKILGAECDSLRSALRAAMARSQENQREDNK